MKKKKLLYESPPNGPACGDCPYREWSKGYTEPEIKDSRVVVFGEASGYWEIYEGMPFAGKSGGKLNVWLGLAGMSRLDVDLVNACRCRPVTWEICGQCWGEGYLVEETDDELEVMSHDCPECAGRGWVPYIQSDGDYNNATPEPGQIVECMKRYGHETLKGLTSKELIVALGASALYALTGYHAIGDYQGSVLETSHGPVVVCYHPAFASRVAEMEPAAQRVFKRLPGILSGSEGAGFDVTYIEQPSEEMLNEYRNAEAPVLDLETTGGNTPEVDDGEILVASASRGPGHAIVVLPGDELRSLLESWDTVVGQYFYAYDAWWLHHRGYPVPETIIDTQVLGHTVNPQTPNDIGFLQTQYAEPPLKEFWKTDSAYATDKGGVALRDTDATSRIERGLQSVVDAQGQRDLVESTIIPWCRLAFELRRDGIRCNVEYLRDAARKLDEEVRRDGAELSKLTGVPLPAKSKTGIPSPKATAEHLYKVLGLPPQRNRKTGKITADEKALRKLQSWCWNNGHSDGLYFLTQMIGKPSEAEGVWDTGLRHRSTMVKDLKKFAKGAPEDSLIHTYHAFVNLTGTVTGRLSYEKPGLHQVPKHCRVAFLPDYDDHVLISFDYKQIEFLCMLWFAKEWDKLRAGLIEKRDYHRMAAALMYKVSEDLVNPSQRQLAKALNFGMIFGKGAKSLAEDLDISIEEADQRFDAWFEAFPGVPKLRARWTQFVSSMGYLQTPAGWKMFFPKEDRENTHRHSVATKIYNYPIQSTAGIRTREALVRLWRALNDVYLPSQVRFMLTVHDSAIVSCHRNLVRDVIELGTKVLTAPYAPMPLDLPGHQDGLCFPVDVEIGENWGSMKSPEEWFEAA